MKIATAVHALVIAALLAPVACDGLPQDPPARVRRHDDAPRPPTTVLATSLMPAMVPTPEPVEAEPPVVSEPPPTEKRAPPGRRKHGRRVAKGRRRRGGDRETFRTYSPE